MLKPYEVKSIIRDALEELDGKLTEPKDENIKSTVMESSVNEDDNGDLIFSFKEDSSSESYDIYKIKIEYL